MALPIHSNLRAGRFFPERFDLIERILKIAYDMQRQRQTLTVFLRDFEQLTRGYTPSML